MPDISLVVVTAVPTINLEVAHVSAQPIVSLKSSNLSLQGLPGKSLEYDWRGTELGVRVEGQEDYEYSNLGVSSTVSYTHDQQVASVIWTVTHNLGKYPSVTIVDTGNSVVNGDISYTDSNTLVLLFSTPFSGKAYMN